jgi:putative flavoprotein involved in K+ transport
MDFSKQSFRASLDFHSKEQKMTSASDRVTEWLKKFDAALQAQDIGAVVSMFDEDCFWRDLVSFTWNIKTTEGPGQVADMLKATLAEVKPSHWKITEAATGDEAMTEAWISFETAVSRGKGHLRLKNGKAWTLLTTMVELKGHEESKGPARSKGVVHGASKTRETWLEKREKEAKELGTKTQPYVLIIGGGQGGIGLGARLRRLGVPTIIIEKNKKPGDSWRNRYKSLCLHDPVWYDHMPYLPFPDDWPVFSPKDKIGDWLEMYTKVMELNYWSSTVCKSAKFDEKKKEWVVKVVRGGKAITLRPKQLVLATGMSAVANVPKFKGEAKFKGDIHHSSKHPGPDKYKGKKTVIIGSNNSAHDIAAALWEKGADVTMIQRSSTHIVKSDTLMDIGLGDLYSEKAVANGVDHHKADLIFASVPYKILHQFQIPVYEKMKERDADFYARLEKAGFMHDWGEDGSGLFMKYLRRGSGYYIDVGASELIADGKVKLKTRVGVEEIKPKSVVFSDGSELPADLIVYATGYGSMNGWAAQLISKDVADKVGKCWGLGSNTTKDPGPWEGELRNMWKPTQVDNLWFHGGNLHQSRHYSQFLSLQLKARMEGLPTPVYGKQKVHHVS